MRRGGQDVKEEIVEEEEVVEEDVLGPGARVKIEPPDDDGENGRPPKAAAKIPLTNTQKFAH